MPKTSFTNLGTKWLFVFASKQITTFEKTERIKQSELLVTEVTAEIHVLAENLIKRLRERFVLSGTDTYVKVCLLELREMIKENFYHPMWYFLISSQLSICRNLHLCV